MSTYGITATNLADSHAAAMARNLYSGGIDLLDLQFSNISNYYYDIAIEYAGGGLLTMTRVWIAAMPTEAALIHISNNGSAPSGTLGNQFDLVPTQYATLAPYTSIGIKRASVSQAIVDGSVEWVVDGYQTETYSTTSQTGFYNSSHDNAELTIVLTTVPVTFNNDTPWIFQTWLDTPLLTYSPPQAFLDGLEKESNYYISFYLGKINGDTASGAQRWYFKKDPGTIHIRTRSVTGGTTGWYMSWDLPDEDDLAWNFNLNNQNGASPDWTFTGGSGGWYHKMWEYDSARDPLYGSRIMPPYWLFIFESTVPIEFNGETYEEPEPTPTDTEYYLGKDGFTMEFGAKTIPTSTHHEPEFNDINNYYLTHEYRPVIRFTSPVDHEEYTVNTNILTDYQKVEPWYDIRANTMPVTWICDGTVKIMPKNNTASYLQGARYPYGMALTSQEITDMTYQDMYPEASLNAVTLGLLVEYFRRLDPDFTSDDVYTEIFFDFYDKNGTTLYGTKSVDFSSLYGSGIDATTTDGKGEEGHSWDLYPGAGDYDDSEYLGEDKDETKLEKPNILPYNKFQKTYIMGVELVEALADKLTTTDDSVFESILEGLEIFGANPMNALIDLRLYPFDVADFTGTSTAVLKDIILGRYDTNIAAIPMNSNPECTIDIGGYKINEKFHSFLDYEPYTTMRLYIPYIGTIDLPPSIYMGHIVSVKLIVDFFTGACRAVIFNDGYAMTYLDGIIGTSIAMTGDNATQYANGIIGNLVGAIGSAAGAVVQGGVGRMDKAVTSAAGAAGDLFDMGLSINDINFQLAGTAAPNVGLWMPQQCHILIARPQLIFDKPYDMGIYGTNIGYATAYTGAINSLTPGGIYYGILPEHIGIGTAYGEPTPTAKEIDMIKEALNNGFYVGIASPE